MSHGAPSELNKEVWAPQSILHLARSLYVRPETYGPTYVFVVPRGTRIVVYCDSGKRNEKKFENHCLTHTACTGLTFLLPTPPCLLFVFALYVLLSSPQPTHQLNELPHLIYP